MAEVPHPDKYGDHELGHKEVIDTRPPRPRIMMDVPTPLEQIKAWAYRRRFGIGFVLAIVILAGLAPHDFHNKVDPNTLRGRACQTSFQHVTQAWEVNHTGYARLYEVQCSAVPNAPAIPPGTDLGGVSPYTGKKIKGPGTQDVYPPHLPAAPDQSYAQK